LLLNAPTYAVPSAMVFISNKNNSISSAQKDLGCLSANENNQFCLVANHIIHGNDMIKTPLNNMTYL